MTDKIEADENGMALPPHQELALVTEAVQMALSHMRNAKKNWDSAASERDPYAASYGSVYWAHVEQVNAATAILNNMLAKMQAEKTAPST